MMIGRDVHIAHAETLSQLFLIGKHNAARTETSQVVRAFHRAVRGFFYIAKHFVKSTILFHNQDDVLDRIGQRSDFIFRWNEPVQRHYAGCVRRQFRSRRQSEHGDTSSSQQALKADRQRPLHVGIGP